MKQLLRRNNIPPANIDDPRYPRSELFSKFRDFYLSESALLFLAEIISMTVLYSSVLNLNINGLIKVSLVIAITLVVGSFINWTFKDRKQENLILELRRERKITQKEEQRLLEIESQPLGFKLIHILRGHSNIITRLAWSPNGFTLASSSHDQTVRLWNAQKGQPLRIFPKDIDKNITWSPDGLLLATAYYHSASNESVINIWHAQSGKLNDKIKEKSKIIDIKWSPDGSTIASLSGTKRNNIRIWDVEKKQLLYTLTENEYRIKVMAWSPNGLTLACLPANTVNEGSGIYLWDLRYGVSTEVYVLKGPTNAACMAWSPDGRVIATGSRDNTIYLWDIHEERCMRTLEGHSNTITSLAFSYDGLFLASKSNDATVMLWRTDTWEKVATLNETISEDGEVGCVAFHPTAPILATLGEENNVIRLWHLDIDTLLNSSATASAISYANAKVVLVGDSSVGKSGLGLVLSGQPFVPTESTHGRRVWTFDRCIVDTDVTHKETQEILLWDLAGQSGYRLIHQLHLNEIAVALVVFDAHSETDPFAGVQYWNRALSQAKRVQGNHSLPLKKFLVAARADRGGVGVSQERIQSLVEELGFDGYFETSAKEGWQITQLHEAIHKSIDWNVIPRACYELYG